MQLEVGKHYVTRDGRKATVLARRRNAYSNPYIVIIFGIESLPDDYEAYLDNGMVVASENRHTDLVSEWVEPPAKKWRAWKISEVPLGAWVRNNGFEARWLIVGAVGDTACVGAIWYQLSHLLETYEWTNTPQYEKSWRPCGIEE